MKKDPFTLPVIADRRLTHEDQNQLRKLWYSDGRSLDARVTKVEKEGIHISTPDSTGFITAEELCTADRVRYGFGTRKEGAWVARLQAHEARQKAAKLPQELKQ